MADSTIPGLPANAALALDDLIEVIDDPGVLPQNMKATIQQVFDAIALLTASGALAAADIAPVFSGGSAKAATIQKIMDAINVLSASAVLATTDVVPVIQGGTAVKATIQKVFDAINVLAASGALAVGDVIAVYTGGAAAAATVQKVYNTINLLTAATTPLVGDEELPVIQSAVAKKTTIDELIQYTNANVPNEDTWVVKGATADGDTSPTALGDSCTAGVGTASVTAADDTQPTGVNELTGSVSGNQGTYTGTAQFRLIKRCSFSAMLSLRETTSVRCFVMLCSNQYSTIGANDGVGVASEWIGFRYSTNAADPAWMYCYGTGGSGSFTTTGVAVDTAAPQLFEVRLRANGTRADFYINRTLVASNIAFTTSTTTNMLLCCGVTTLTGAGRNLRYYQHKVAQRWF